MKRNKRCPACQSTRIIINGDTLSCKKCGYVNKK